MTPWPITEAKARDPLGWSWPFATVCMDILVKRIIYHTGVQFFPHPQYGPSQGMLIWRDLELNFAVAPILLTQVVSLTSLEMFISVTVNEGLCDLSQSLYKSSKRHLNNLNICINI